jgi:excisionase family DNA binding protein
VKEPTPAAQGGPSLDAIAADPTVAQGLPRSVLEALALRAITVQATITTVLLAARESPAAPRNVGDEADRLLTVPEVARRLGVPVTRVYEFARRQEIPVVRLGRYVRVPERALREWIEQQRVDKGPRRVRQSAKARG